jgi:alkylhydroperoxidase family enzyme
LPFSRRRTDEIELDTQEAPLDPSDRAMMAFVEKVVLNAERITSADIEVLRSHGYQDMPIFDVIGEGGEGRRKNMRQE